jgi:hypothetical protein
VHVPAYWVWALWNRFNVGSGVGVLPRADRLVIFELLDWIQMRRASRRNSTAEKHRDEG